MGTMLEWIVQLNNILRIFLLIFSVHPYNGYGLVTVWKTQHIISKVNLLKSLKTPNHLLLSALLTSESLEVPSLKNAKYRINQVIDALSNIESIKIQYLTVTTKEVAMECKHMISSGSTDFFSLASSISLCDQSKLHGGISSWIKLSSNVNVTAESFIPIELINEACHMNKGDLSVISSRIININNTSSNEYEYLYLWHLLRLVDVESKLSPALIKRRKENFALLKGLDKRDINTTSMSYYIDTMGCQMNIADSERMESQLLDLGYYKTMTSTNANVVILNTCSIRDHAEQKVYSYIGPHASRKRKGDDVSIVVAGCVAQQEGDALTRRFPEIDIVMGPQYSNRLSDLLEAVANGHQVVATEPIYQTEDKLRASRAGGPTAFVNVIYGCNERCTYCVVPGTRGVEQSRTKEAILEEVRGLVNNEGCKEVTLLGQNIDSWGREMDPMQKFADLLSAVGNVEGISRVRFLTSHPKYMSERVILAVAGNTKLMPCFNIPFQAGSNIVLKNMRRGYTRERYLQIVSNIRNHLPDAAITADCIVGFPGETDEQFQETLDLMEEVKFELVNAAAYSPRPNTPAAAWDNDVNIQVPEPVKQARLHRINTLGAIHAMERSSRFVGRIQEVLVEDVSSKDPRQVYGRNPHSRLVYFAGSLGELQGRIALVEITEARAYSLQGILVGVKER